MALDTYPLGNPTAASQSAFTSAAQAIPFPVTAPEAAPVRKVFKLPHHWKSILSLALVVVLVGGVVGMHFAGATSNTSHVTYLTEATLQSAMSSNVSQGHLKFVYVFDSKVPAQQQQVSLIEKAANNYPKVTFYFIDWNQPGQPQPGDLVTKAGAATHSELPVVVTVNDQRQALAPTLVQLVDYAGVVDMIGWGYAAKLPADFFQQHSAGGQQAAAQQ